MIYLASPYTHPSAGVREDRYERALFCSAHLMRLGIQCYSPIVHCHPMVTVAGLPMSFGFWASFDERMIIAADRLVVLPLPGWEQSFGIASELRIARLIRKPTFQIINPDADWSLMTSQEEARGQMRRLEQ